MSLVGNEGARTSPQPHLHTKISGTLYSLFTGTIGTIGTMQCSLYIYILKKIIIIRAYRVEHPCKQGPGFVPVPKPQLEQLEQTFNINHLPAQRRYTSRITYQNVPTAIYK